MEITVRIYNNKNKLVAYRVAKNGNSRKIYGRLASAVGQKWFLRVDYGYAKNVLGQRVLFKNEGEYTNLIDAKKALSAFLEKD